MKTITALLFLCLGSCATYTITTDDKGRATITVTGNIGTGKAAK